MTYTVLIECNDQIISSYTANFIPRVGDTIVDRCNNIPMTVTEVAYFIPCNNEACMSVVVKTRWR